MSDTFNHELDALDHDPDSVMNTHGWLSSSQYQEMKAFKQKHSLRNQVGAFIDSSDSFSTTVSRVKRTQKSNCRKVSFQEISHQTEKAYLLKDDKGQFWVPKALCKRYDENSFLIFNTFQIKRINK